MRVRILAPALLLGLSSMFAACGSDDDAADVASAGGEPSAEGNDDTAGMSDHEKMLAFAQCLREAGLDIEDPEPGSSVQFRLTPENKDLIKQAQEACQEYAPQGQSGSTGGMNPESMQEFAGCMRENGVEAFPDPDPNQGGMRLDSEVAEDPDLETAQQACAGILGGGMVGGQQ